MTTKAEKLPSMQRVIRRVNEPAHEIWVIITFTGNDSLDEPAQMPGPSLLSYSNNLDKGSEQNLGF